MGEADIVTQMISGKNYIQLRTTIPASAMRPTPVTATIREERDVNHVRRRQGAGVDQRSLNEQRWVLASWPGPPHATRQASSSTATPLIQSRPQVSTPVVTAASS